MDSPVACRTRSRAAAASGQTERRADGPPCSVKQELTDVTEGAAATRAGAKRSAENEAGSSAGAAKRPRLQELCEEDFACSICLSLLVDPVVSPCGHDFCELCLRRWAVDQGKDSCPACRHALPRQMPDICRRLQRTVEALFPERVKERQEEVEEQRRALAAEKRARQEAAQRHFNRPPLQASFELTALLERLIAVSALRQNQLAPAAAASQRQTAPPPPPPHSAWQPTQQQQEGRLVQRRYPTRAAVAATSNAHGLHQRAADVASVGRSHYTQQQQQQFQGVRMVRAFGLAPAGSSGAAAAPPTEPAPTARPSGSAWPTAPPLQQMQFSMGWHEAPRTRQRRSLPRSGPGRQQR